MCGGSTIDDTRPGCDISSQELASSQYSRMALTEEGIAAGWQVGFMPHTRTMPDAVLLPTGDVLINTPSCQTGRSPQCNSAPTSIDWAYSGLFSSALNPTQNLFAILELIQQPLMESGLITVALGNRRRSIRPKR